MKPAKIYPISIGASGVFPLPAIGDYFKILTATGPVEVTGDTFGNLGTLDAGQGLQDTPFSRLTFRNTLGAQNDLQVLIADEKFVDDRVLGSMSLVQATLDTLTRPVLPASAWNDTSTLVANTPVTVFAPAANTGGAIIWTAESIDNASGAALVQTMLAKASAPVTVADGQVVMLAQLQAFTTTDGYAAGRMVQPQRLAAGLGLYFISSQNGAAAGKFRHCRYTLL